MPPVRAPSWPLLVALLVARIGSLEGVAQEPLTPDMTLTLQVTSVVQQRWREFRQAHDSMAATPGAWADPADACTPAETSGQAAVDGSGSLDDRGVSGGVRSAGGADGDGLSDPKVNVWDALAMCSSQIGEAEAAPPPTPPPTPSSPRVGDVGGGRTEEVDWRRVVGGWYGSQRSLEPPPPPPPPAVAEAWVDPSYGEGQTYGIFRDQAQR